jgi:hypothetical protein
MKLMYAWRVVRADGRPSTVTVAVADAGEALLVERLARKFEREGLKLEPLALDELRTYYELVDAA